jgi:hypothetical protein
LLGLLFPLKHALHPSDDFPFPFQSLHQVPIDSCLAKFLFPREIFLARLVYALDLDSCFLVHFGFDLVSKRPGRFPKTTGCCSEHFRSPVDLIFPLCITPGRAVRFLFCSVSSSSVQPSFFFAQLKAAALVGSHSQDLWPRLRVFFKSIGFSIVRGLLHVKIGRILEPSDQRLKFCSFTSYFAQGFLVTCMRCSMKYV